MLCDILVVDVIWMFLSLHDGECYILHKMYKVQTLWLILNISNKALQEKTKFIFGK